MSETDSVASETRTFPLEKTSEEIFDLYKKGMTFVESLGDRFDKYLQQQKPGLGSK